MTVCKVCNSKVNYVFSATILHKHQVTYNQCIECGLLQTESPYWLDDAYTDAIASADTGLVQRNISIATKLASLLYFEFDSKASYLDIAGGYGMLTRLMRDYGFNFYWSDKYCKNLLARNFEVDKSPGKFLALTAFEVLEHVYDPVSFIKEAFEQYDTHTLIFTTELFKDRTPPKDWWYFAFNTGQHISFYKYKTLERIAEKLGLNFYSANGIHIISDKKISLQRMRFLTNRYFSFIFASFVKRKMQSLTFVDHKKIMNSQNFTNKLK